MGVVVVVVLVAEVMTKIQAGCFLTQCNTAETTEDLDVQMNK